MSQKEVIEKLRSSMLAAYSDLQNGNSDQAKNALKVGLEGGSVNNPLDFIRCVQSWEDKYSNKERNQ